MKLLINLCAHDGIISHYTGVGTMVHKYIVMLDKILGKSAIDYKINLITPEYNTNSFGYSETYKNFHNKFKNMSIVQISNGTAGLQNFGNIKNWETLTSNTADFINAQDLQYYDKVITIYNDVPFTSLASHLDKSEQHIKVWIPHSSAKIHNEDAFTDANSDEYVQRLNLEECAVGFINDNPNCYLAYICEFMKNHFIDDYNLKMEKLISLRNGEILEETDYLENISEIVREDFKKIENFESIILSFGRAEKYKNYEATMLLGKELGVQAVVIPQGYFKGQPIMNDYKKIARETNAILFIDAHFDFVKYILKNYRGKLIILVPSKKEPMGLIINEIRKLNKENLMIVANNITGLREQINDGIDGILINVDDVQQSVVKIKKYFNEANMKQLAVQGYKTVEEKYNFEKIFQEFFNRILEK